MIDSPKPSQQRPVPPLAVASQAEVCECGRPLRPETDYVCLPCELLSYEFSKPTEAEEAYNRETARLFTEATMKAVRASKGGN